MVANNWSAPLGPADGHREAFTYIQAKNGVTLEDEVQIGSYCAVYSVSTLDGKEGPVLLKRNCRIGTAP